MMVDSIKIYKTKHRKRNVLCLFLCLIIPFTLKSQDIQLLHLQLSQTASDEEKAPLLWEIGKKYQKEDAHHKALEYLEQARSLSGNSFDIQDQILLNYDVATSGSKIKKYEAVQKAYDNIYKIYSDKNDAAGKNFTLNKIAELNEKKGNTSLAIQQYVKVSEFYKSQNMSDALLNNYNNIGSIYYKQEDLRNAIVYYLKAVQLAEQCKTCFNVEEQTTLFLNVANTYAAKKDMLQAEKYFKSALSLQKSNTIRTAEIKTYLAANYVINNKKGKAIDTLIESITLIEINNEDKEDKEAKRILLQNYFLLSKIYESEDLKASGAYSNRYLKLKEELNNEEHQILKSEFNNQLLVEANENKLLNLIAEKEKAEKKNTQLENSAREKELLIKNKELDLLKRSQELQQAQIHNQQLEKEKMRQIIKMAEHELKSENQKKVYIQQQLTAETIKSEVSRQQKELMVVNHEKELQAKQLQEAKTQNQLKLSVIVLMILLLLIGIFLIIHLNRARKILAKQNEFIQKQHQEISEKNISITKKNDELTQFQQEILFKSQSLEIQNEELSEAQSIIELQNAQLKSYMESLEEQVQERTHQLTTLNQELVKNNQQLEQFGFIVAHNLRGPVARLLGLSTIFKMSSGKDEEREFVVGKIQQEVTMLDTIISDLNIILQIKKGIENEVVDLELDQKLKIVVENIKEDINETGTSIISDFSEINNILFIQPYLHSIFYNLISNAIKYRSPSRVPVIKISSSKINEQTVMLKIEDNGLGMDLEKHGKNIFGLYKRFHLHKEGKGLGLYLVKTQMEMLGGRIEIESTPDVGTTFKLYFIHSESKTLVEV